MSDVGTTIVVADGATLQRRRRVGVVGDRFPLLAALAAAADGPLAAEAAAAIEVIPVTPDEIAEALEHVWSDHCADTGCIPSNFTIHGPSTTQVSAQFRGTDFSFRVAEWINLRRTGRPRETRQSPVKADI